MEGLKWIRTYLQSQLSGVDQLAKTAQYFILDSLFEAAFQGYTFTAHAHGQYHCSGLVLVLALHSVHTGHLRNLISLVNTLVAQEV